MIDTFKLTVNDIMSSPYFQKAEVVAGRKGLKSQIRWVHIMEVTEIGQLLNGNELILSTGVGWRENGKVSLSFLQQLIDKEAAGICIELGTYISAIPQEMIQLANKHDFPIIVFHEEVRFIDITQKLNGTFMENQYKAMQKLESIANQFNRLLLSADGFKRILRLLHQSLNVQVAYVSVENEVEFYPPVDRIKENSLLEKMKAAPSKNMINSPTTSASKPIQALGHKFADLIILSEGQNLTDFDYLVLDRAATALSQDRLRLLYVEEKRKQQENHWLLDWLNGEHKKEDIHEYVTKLDPSIDPSGCAACICEMNIGAQEVDFTYYSMIFRTVFEQHGFLALVSYEGNSMAFALVNKRNKANWKPRLKDAIDQISKNSMMKKNLSNSISFGIGKLQNLDQLHLSYEKAKETLFIQKKMEVPNVYFYDDLHVYRIVLQLNKQKNLHEFIEDYLGPVIEFDQAKNGQMFETLKVFLEVNGSKKDAAERLFVVRQTLYHRIDKLKELLGEDFMEPEKRLAIEVAVYARGFVEKLAFN